MQCYSYDAPKLQALNPPNLPLVGGKTPEAKAMSKEQERAARDRARRADVPARCA